MEKNETLERPEKRENLFNKKQLMSSEKFGGYRDILSSLLMDGREYSVEAAEKMIENYLKGKVK